MSKKQDNVEVVTIAPLNFRTIQVKLKGTAPYMQARFSEKTKQAMMAKMMLGSQAKKGTKREARNFDEDFQNAMHVSEDGWIGVPAAAIRAACIDVCRMAGYKMTYAKMSIFVREDGLDKSEGIPLIKLIASKKPERNEMMTRNATGVADIRVRPMWREWALDVRIRYDAGQFSSSDVINLLNRAGHQIGIGEGRPYSKSSYGLGFGTFEVEKSQ